MEISKPKPFNITTPEKWLKDLLSKLTKRNKDDWNFTSYMLDDKTYLKYDDTFYLFFCEEKIYRVLENRFNMEPREIRQLVKKVVEETHNLKDIHPLRFDFTNNI